MYPDNGFARKTRNFPWSIPLTFNPDAPFAAGSLGVLCNSAGVAAPTAATARLLVSSANEPPFGSSMNTTPGDTQPITNPTDLGTGYYWYEELPEADIIEIRPYLVLYSSSGHTALASAAAAQGITANLSFFLINLSGKIRPGLPREYGAEIKGKVTVTNAATRISSASRQLPLGAQWCDAATVVTDYTISPGIVKDGEVATGALRLRFDQEGALGLLTYVSDLTANAGCGWQRRHL